MSKVYSASQILDRLRAEKKAGRPLFIPNCGFGLSAKMQERGGADIICISATSYWRMKGQGSLSALMPNADINEIIFRLAPEIAANIQDTPLISLSGAFNPLLPHRDHLERLRAAGVSGINPFMIQIYGPDTVAQMDAIGIGWEREVDMIRTAAEMDMFTLAYAFSPEEARILTAEGAHAISSHFGSTIGGQTGALSSLPLEEAAAGSQAMFDAARAENPDVLLFAHGGPIEGPAEVEYVLNNTDADGFVGGSAAERVPIEHAILAATQKYKAIPY